MTVWAECPLIFRGLIKESNLLRLILGHSPDKLGTSYFIPLFGNSFQFLERHPCTCKFPVNGGEARTGGEGVGIIDIGE